MRTSRCWAWSTSWVTSVAASRRPTAPSSGRSAVAAASGRARAGRSQPPGPPVGDRHEAEGDVVGQRPAVAAHHLGQQAVEQGRAGQAPTGQLVGQGDQALDADPVPAAGSGPAFDEAVGVQQQRAPGAQHHRHGLPGGVGHDPEQVAVLAVPHRPARRPHDDRRRVPGHQQLAGLAVGLDDQGRHGGEGQRLDLGAQERVEGGQRVELVEPGQGQRPPGAAQPGGQGGGVRPVAGDIADEDRDLAVGRLDRVVEVAPSSAPPGRAGTAPPPPRPATAAGAAGSAPAPCGCCRPGGARPRTARGSAGRPLPLDGVAHRPGQQLVVHPALDQVVLRPGRHRLPRPGARWPRR